MGFNSAFKGLMYARMNRCYNKWGSRNNYVHSSISHCITNYYKNSLCHAVKTCYWTWKPSYMPPRLWHHIPVTNGIQAMICCDSLIVLYTECPRRNVPDFRRMFLKLKYTNITQNTYIQIWTVTEIMAREVWKYDSCYTLIDYQIHIKTSRNMWFL